MGNQEWIIQTYAILEISHTTKKGKTNKQTNKQTRIPHKKLKYEQQGPYLKFELI